MLHDQTERSPSPRQVEHGQLAPRLSLDVSCPNFISSSTADTTFHFG